MGYKQPGYGNGKRPSTVPTSPLNLRNKKKEKEYRERILSRHESPDAKKFKYKGQETNVGRIIPSQYKGMSKKQRNKLIAKAEEKGLAAQAKLDAGGKLSKREQRFLDEHNYNVKRSKSKKDVEAEKQRIKEERANFDSYDAQADRFRDMLMAMGPDAYRDGFQYSGYDADKVKQDASYDQDGRKYMNPAYYNRPEDQWSRYVPKRFVEKYPELAAKFNLKEGTHTYNLPQMKDGGMTKLETKNIKQIPVKTPEIELKRPVRPDPVVEKKKVVKKPEVKPEVKPKPKVTESLYPQAIPEGTRANTTATHMTDLSHWVEGHEDKYDAALKYKKRKNKKSKK